MKNSLTHFRTGARLIACLVTVVVASALIRAQAPQVVQIPFPFSIPSSKKPLPAGSYGISANRDALLLQANTGEKATQIIVTRLTGPNSFLQAGSLVFDSTSGRNVLLEVWLPGQDGILLSGLPKGHTRAVVSFSDLSVSGHASGKDAFELTCARCHGEGGKGNAQADRYFGVTIPRLNTAEVQAKSDAELREIIVAGTQTMPPVEVDESGFRHRLPSQDVDSVIAYLRTLKP